MTEKEAKKSLIKLKIAKGLLITAMGMVAAGIVVSGVGMVGDLSIQNKEAKEFKNFMDSETDYDLWLKEKAELYTNQYVCGEISLEEYGSKINSLSMEKTKQEFAEEKGFRYSEKDENLDKTFEIMKGAGLGTCCSGLLFAGGSMLLAPGNSRKEKLDKLDKEFTKK